MYGLPENVDLRFLSGVELEQVCIGIHDVILNFSGKITITMQGRFSHVREALATSADESLPRTASGLVSLLGARILAIEAERNGTLKLVFSNGEVLTVFDDSSDFESYVITNGDRVIVV